MSAPMVQRRPNGQLMPGAAVLNPHGRPKGNAIEQLREKYIGRLDEFFEVLIDLTKSKNENMRLRATAELLDRLVGKPQISADVSVTRLDVGQLYLQALQRASQRAHAVPSEPVVEGKANGNAPP
jgi:hypothetical protein